MQGLLAPGKVLQGRYKIIKHIKVGGMGAIYRAEDTRFPGKICAVKEMLDNFISQDERDKGISDFKREANLLATLTHQNIPKVTDVFTEAGRYYLVMDYIDGEDLEKKLEDNKKPFSEDQVVKWALQICDVLKYLHSQKPNPIIYRDMKPSNIMITKDGMIKLIDFGIARHFQRSGVTNVGTEGYAPREQYRGKAEPRSDIYSLGATMHHLLTNRDPKKDPFLFPPVRQFNSSLSLAIESILDKALKDDINHRYRAVDEFENVLRAFLSAQIRICQYCGCQILRPAARFCSECGKLISPQISPVGQQPIKQPPIQPRQVSMQPPSGSVPCPNCGFYNKPGAVNCESCKNPIAQKPKPVKPIKTPSKAPFWGKPFLILADKKGVQWQTLRFATIITVFAFLFRMFISLMDQLAEGSYGFGTLLISRSEEWYESWFAIWLLAAFVFGILAGVIHHKRYSRKGALVGFVTIIVMLLSSLICFPVQLIERFFQAAISIKNPGSAIAVWTFVGIVAGSSVGLLVGFRQTKMKRLYPIPIIIMLLLPAILAFAAFWEPAPKVTRPISITPVLPPIVTPPNTTYLEISKDNVDMRSGPGANYNLAARIDKGTQLKQEAICGEWSKVVLPNGQEGWVHEDFYDVIRF